MKKKQEFKKITRRAKLRLLKMHYESRVGHIGGNLSAIEIILFLHHCILPYVKGLFVLSKGHAAGALYITLWSIGELYERDIKMFHKDGTKTAGHPVPLWNSHIKVATGSLGHGLPMSCGLALANKLQNNNEYIYCLCSDGEWEEGSNWEALIFAKHNNLSNLVIIIDNNKLQAFGSTAEVASLVDLKEKFVGFGLEVIVGNGHNYDSLRSCFSSIKSSSNGPKIILFNTIKGNGISFMENKMEWHYLQLNSEQYKKARLEIKNER